MAEGGFFAGSIWAKLSLDTTGFSGAVRAVEAQTKQLSTLLTHAGDKLTDLGKRMSSVGRNLTVGVTLPLAAVGGAALKMAMDAVESENLFEVSMGGMAKAARDWSVEVSQALGMNQYEIRKNVATFNVMLESMGLGTDAAFDMAKGLTQLSYDMASFYNLKPDEAFQKLQSGISGEIEPLKRLGIIVNETAIKTWALTHGVIGQGEELTESQKILARYNVIIEATSKAQGDMARTLDSPSNKLRSLKSQAQEMAIELGQRMIPVFDKVMNVVKSGLKWWDGLSDKQQDLIIKAGMFAAALGPVVGILGKLVSVAGFALKAVGALAGALSASVAAWGAAAAAIAYYVSLLHQKAEAEARAERAQAMLEESQALLTEKLNAAAVAAGWTKDQMAELIKKYDGNVAALAMAIHKGKEGIEIQAGLAKVGGEHAAAIELAKGKLEQEKGALNDVFKPMMDFGDATGKATEEVKSLAEELGITTRAEVEDRLKKLMRALVEYKGKLTADEVRRLKKEINELQIELSGLLDVPAPKVGKEIYDDLMKIPGAFPQIEDTFTKIDGGLGDMAGAAGQATEETLGYFDGLFNDIASGFSTTIENWMGGATTFKDFMKGIWDDIKKAFFRMIGQMVAGEAIKAIKGLFTDLLGTAKNAASGIATATSSIGSAVGGIATGIATLITSLATAIATAAETLAAAAPAILKVGAVAIALYAGFKVVEGLVSSLFGSGGGKQTDVTYWLKLQKDLQQEMHDWLFINAQDKLNYYAEKLEDIKAVIIDGIRTPLNAICDKLDWIGGIVGPGLDKIINALGKLKGAQSGAVLTEPQLVMTHGTPSRPEYIIPEPNLNALVTGAQKAQVAEGARSVTLSFNINALDGESVEKVTRTRIIPTIQNVLDHCGLRVPAAAMRGY